MTGIIDYGLGNLTSVLNMHKRLGIRAFISNDIQVLQHANRFILPGVGHFDKGMKNLFSMGLSNMLEMQVQQMRKPILGICLGAQLLTRSSEEGVQKGLGWVDADTVKFSLDKTSRLKIPHMGWEEVKMIRSSELWKNVEDNARYYHVHSFHFNFSDESQVIGTAMHSYEFATAFQRKNIYGVQFHPEKSLRFGMKIIENFSALG